MPTQLDVGDVLRTSFEVIQKNLGTFILLASIIIVPNIVVAISAGVLTPYLVPAGGSAPDLQGMLDTLLPLMPIYLFGIVVVTVTYAIAQAGMTYTAVEHMAGRTAGASTAMMAAFRSLLSLLAASFLMSLGMIIGMLMCCIPAVFVLLFFCLTTPAILVERLGPIDGLSRSIELTEGHKVTIFLVFLAIFGVALAFGMCVMGPITVALMVGPASQGAAMDPFSPAQITLAILRTVVNGALSAFGTTAIAVIYARIRGIRDGMDAEAFARVFA